LKGEAVIAKSPTEIVNLLSKLEKEGTEYTESTIKTIKTEVTKFGTNVDINEGTDKIKRTFARGVAKAKLGAGTYMAELLVN
jgi:hypothetical protein